MATLEIPPIDPIDWDYTPIPPPDEPDSGNGDIERLGIVIPPVDPGGWGEDGPVIIPPRPPEPISFGKQPQPYEFAGNCSDIVVYSQRSVTFTLIIESTEVAREEFSPIRNQVTIRIQEHLKRYVDNRSYVTGNDSTPAPKVQYTVVDSDAELGVTLSGSFYCINGGHAGEVDTVQFLSQNFLTWQPQSVRTAYSTPQLLRFVAVVASECFIKGYFVDDESVTKSLKTFSANTLNTINVQFGVIRQLFERQPLYFDCWFVGEGGAESYVQRYFLDAAPIPNCDVFTFLNSLGGIDSVVFSGDRVEVLEIEGATAIRGELMDEFALESKRVFRKFTGYTDNENIRLWWGDFFNSSKRFHIQNGRGWSIVLVDKPKIESTSGELAGFEFTFCHSFQSRYLSLSRVDTPEVLEIIDPEGEVFSLAPRLAEFRKAELGGAILIPVQYSSGNEWLSLPLSEILSSENIDFAPLKHKHYLVDIEDVDKISQEITNGYTQVRSETNLSLNMLGQTVASKVSQNELNQRLEDYCSIEDIEQNVNEAFGKVVIGGVNLIPNSSFANGGLLPGYVVNGGSVYVMKNPYPDANIPSTDNVMRVDGNFGGGIYAGIPVWLTQRYSFWAYSTDLNPSVFVQGYGYINFPSRKWTRICPPPFENIVTLYLGNNSSVTYFARVQLENGNVVSDWRVAPTDNPPSEVSVLATYNIGSAGWTMFGYGSKKSTTNVYLSSTGRYIVYHSIGHTNYTVQVTITEAISSIFIAKVAAKGTSSTTIHIQNTSGTYVNANFDITFTGPS